MRILIEGMTCGVGGKETYIINMYREMLHKQYKFTFIAYDSHIAYEDELLSTGARIVHLPPRNANYFKFRKALELVFKNDKYDVLWAHKTSLSSCEILEVARKAGVLVRIVHSHSSSNMGGIFTLLMHLYNKKRIFSLATDYLACSEVAAKWFYENHQAVIVKNGFDIKKYEYNNTIRNAIREKYKIQNQFVLGHVGRFSIEKNHMKLLEVFYEYIKKRPDSCLILCGDGEERFNIESKIKELAIVDKVLLLGMVTNVHEILQAMDVFVMPSQFEGLPYAILEAQAAGLKCVVSDTVSKESDIMGWNHFLALNKSNEAWAQEINKIDYVYDRDIAQTVLKQEGFDIKSCVKQIVKIFNNCSDN